MRQPIFTFNKYRNGSYIDPISGTVGNNFNGEFKRTTKGLAWKSDGVSEINTNVNPSLSTFTLECWLNANDVTSLQNVGSNKKLGAAEDGYDFIISSGNILFGVANGLTINQSYKDISAYQNKYIHIIATYDGSINKIYVNNVEGVEASANGSPNGVRNIRIAYDDNSGRFLQEAFIGKYVIYDGVISATERASLYKQFLKASPVTYGNAGTKLTKPSNYITNLENEEGLVAVYNFNKDTVKTDKVLDISGNDNDGSYNGNPLLTKDGLKFDDENILVGTNIPFGTKHTIHFRGYTDFDSSGILGNNNYYYAFIGGNRFSFYFGGGRVDIPISLEENKMHSFSIVRNELNVKLYVDGVFYGEGNETVNNIFYYSAIGGAGNTLYKYDGVLKDVRLYNRVVSEQEVKDYHNSFIKPEVIERFEDNPVGTTAPIGWIKGTGEYEVKEKVDETKYLENTIAGTIGFQIKNTNGYSSIDYFNGSEWNTISGVLSTLISENVWLSYSNGILTFDLGLGDSIANIKILNGVKQL